MKPLQSFIVSARLPQSLEKLKELAYNFWWCWNSDAKELFVRIDRELWSEVNHNPVLLINKLSQEKLQELSQQQNFISFLDYIYDKYQKYLTEQSWFQSSVKLPIKCIAYYSTEYGINESFPNYSGGLGVLSGDHLKSASDLGLPLVGIGLLYQQGYFRQHLTQHGWQNESYNTNDFYSLSINLVKNADGSPLILDIDMPYGKVFFQIWKQQIGRVPLFLLDTNIEHNGIEEYRDITDQLYGGTRETRIQQEIVLGIGGTRALYAMGIEPEVIHINEGHAAFALFERTKYLMQKLNLDFRSAKQITRLSSVFTTHTPVPAGNETFSIDRVNNYMENYYKRLGISKEYFMALGQAGDYRPDEPFSMTILGLKLSSYHNGVSKLHGEVARKMWQHIWKCFPIDEVPIKSVTNGIHTLTWIAREFAELFDRYLSPGWKTETDNQDIWDKLDIIPSEELWREKQRRRFRLILFAREYLQKRQKEFIGPEQASQINEYLNPDALTIGFARRFATYKRATLLFRDMDRLSKLLTNPQKPVQIIIAGKAHPHDTQGKESIQSIIQKVRAYKLERHVVFLEDYDMIIARFMVKGCDVWLNTPIRPMEASGTSGMKAAINATLNLSILDGWWDEGYDGLNGFSIGAGEEYNNYDEQDSIEAGALYEMLEKVIVQLFYDRNNVSRIPETWINYMKNSIKSNAGRFSTMRMVKDYANEFYIPAFQNFSNFCEKDPKLAEEFKNWKDNVRNAWADVQVVNANSDNIKEPFVGMPIKVSAEVSLGNLTPSDVVVQVYYGSLDFHNELVDTNYQELNLVKSEGHQHFYEGEYICPDTGKQGFTIRILPKHKLMINPAELYICSWG